MEILLVTPTHPFLKLWQPQNLWRRALIQLGHKVKLLRFHQWNRFWLRRLISTRQQDEVFFSAGRDIVFPLKHTVFFSGVPFSMLSHSEKVTGLQAKLVVTNDPTHAQDWLKRGAASAVCLPISAIDPKLHHPVAPLLRFQADVVFIGGLSLERQQLFHQLAQAKINLRLYGTLPENFLSPQLKHLYRGPAWGKAIPRIYSSCRIALNPLPSHLPHGFNLRAFEIPACGAFPLTYKLPSRPDDLIAKINYYLAHPHERKKIAQEKFKTTHRHHTYQKRFKTLLQLLQGL